MLPCIWPGDIVEVVKAELTSLRKGDVLLLERGGRLFCHRLVRAVNHSDGCRIFTRGDFLTVEDPPFGPNELFGVVEGRRPTWRAILAAALLRTVCRISPRPAAWVLSLRARAIAV